MTTALHTKDMSIGVVGLGLMGTSIVTALLLAGHDVKAIAPLPQDLDMADERITSQLTHAGEAGLFPESPDHYRTALVITSDYSALEGCALVIECVIEVASIKQAVYRTISDAVDAGTVIATNTSAIPISHLQQFVPHPERFMGIHWAEPAYMTRFLEITCGEKTSYELAQWVHRLATHWKKEPTLLRRDIRGFITNRLMYAVYREAFAIIDRKASTLEDIDKVFRYDAGSWMTIMGIFKRMDYLGTADFVRIYDHAFKRLSNDEHVPAVMQSIVDDQGKGIYNLKGLYPYTREEAASWEEAFALFNRDIFHLAEKYTFSPADTEKL